MKNFLNLPFGEFERGQVLLISLLILAVGLTIGLSVATRTITTIRMTTAEDSSQKAFSAAEAGIEKALTKVDSDIFSGEFSDAKYDVTVTTLDEQKFLINGGNQIAKDEGADIYLGNYPDYNLLYNGNLSIYWGENGDKCDTNEANNTMAAIELVLIKKSKADPEIDHFVFDPCSARKNINKFDATVSGSYPISGKNFIFKADINVVDGLLIRLIPLYSKTYAAVSGVNLPAQGVEISSIGSSGGTQRKIITYKSNPKVPDEFFQYVIFSPN